MAFFDDLSKKLSNAGQGAVQSTKNFANVSKINTQINDEEKKINEAYFQIGKLYFDIYKDSPDEKLATYVQIVKDSLNNIDTYNDQIREIKGIAICPTCGAEVVFQSAFCNACGTKMPLRAPSQPIPENSVQCSACGVYVSRDCKFCTACGNVMTVPEPQIQVSAPSAQTPVAQNVGKICPSCGKSLSVDAVFCTGCGQQV